MRHWSALLIVLVWGVHAATVSGQQEQEFDAEDVAFFESKIRPVLIDRCYECHSGDSPESRFSVEFREGLLTGGEFGPAVLPGKPAESLLIQAIKHDEFLKMPPKEKLSIQQVVDFTRWVEMGLPWPKSDTDLVMAAVGRTEGGKGPLFTASQKAFWAFQPPVLPVLPRVSDSSWAQSPIDYFVLAKLDHAGLRPAPAADKRTMIRRATFDLTGLPPTPEEIDLFLADDSPLAYSCLIERLLASPRYGERWGRHWLDVARYADSNGLDENLSYANAYHYRDYVIASMNKDKPYKRFVREQIAGDLLPRSSDAEASLEQLAATGFLAIGPKMLAEDDPVKMQMDIIDEQVSTLGQAFMGLTLGCARCHDHKFDPIPTDDYYALAGIFKSSKTMENHKVVAVWYERPLVSPQIAAESERLEQKITETQQQLTEIQNQARDFVNNDLRSKTNQYLKAVREIQQMQQYFRSTDVPLAATKQDAAFEIKEGYLAIEAEAYHRGNVVIVPTGYGEGIGIIATKGAGYIEYDIEVTHPGSYALEVRYAAANARPVSLLLDGSRVSDSILGGVTGSWYPDTQRWTAEVRVDLTAGKHTLRLDSKQVYPHIDKLALVLESPSPWPFAALPPPTLTHIAAKFDIHMSLLQTWQSYFKALDKDQYPDHLFFNPWMRFAELTEGDFKLRSKILQEELQSDSGLGATTPAPLKVLFQERPPSTLSDVADIYQTLTRRIWKAFANGDQSDQEEYRKIYDEISSPESPLTWSADIPQAAFPPELFKEQSRLNHTISDLSVSRQTIPVAMGVTEAKGEDIRVHLRGSHIALGEIAPRQMLQIIEGTEQTPITGSQSGRLELANWITKTDHPLLSRVLVNRVWRWRFGRGIVSTVDNFGALGELPTHPQLLDWLAIEFMRKGGSLKELHRTMMLSSTYQMGTAFDQVSSDQDPDNELLWRFNRRRLSAEELRDSFLVLGDGLDLAMGGSLLRVKNRAYVTVSGSNVTDEYENQRRSVYLPVIRSSVYEVFQTLDFPDPAVSNGDRNTTTVAPQALLMMNSDLVADSTSALARRLLSIELSERVERVYSLILGRRPTPDEISVALGYAQQVAALSVQGGQSIEAAELLAWQSYCRVLLSSNEFFYVE